ncbi:hypothetical protein BH10PSE1_BH10PSE1_26920 [soil metagenome]
MRVRIKTWLLAALGALTLGAVAGEAAAQCNSGCPVPPPPVCCEAPPAPPSPPSPPGGCCEAPPPPNYPGGNFNGNFNVNVNVNANANANANSNSSLIRARGAGDVYVGGGGGAYFSVDQPYPTVIQGLNVEGGAAEQVIQQAVQRSRWAFSRVVIQALCIDDRDIPHPASQVQPGRDIASGYNGELYRCIAGTRLQYTLAEFAEQISFDHGQTMSCQKGESLWYSEGASAGGASEYAAQYAAAYAAQYGGQQGPGGPTGGGIVECRPQTPERDCNERSLLRRYGAGIKILTLWREEIYTEYEQQTVQAASSMSMGYSLTLDGGVGGRVF